MRATEHSSGKSSHSGEGVDGLRQSIFATLAFRNGVLTLRPAGPRLTEREAIVIAQQASDAMKSITSGMRVFLVDLSQVQMLSSFGLGMCINLHNQARAKGCRTLLFGLTQELQDLLKMMKVDRLYTIVSNPSDLRAALAA